VTLGGRSNENSGQGYDDRGPSGCELVENRNLGVPRGCKDERRKRRIPHGSVSMSRNDLILVTALPRHRQALSRHSSAGTRTSTVLAETIRRRLSDRYEHSRAERSPNHRNLCKARSSQHGLMPFCGPNELRRSCEFKRISFRERIVQVLVPS